MALPTPKDYRILSETSLVEWLATLPEASTRLGGDPSDWSVGEVGDGNLNMVFLVEGPAGGLCVKQALPYVRLVGEGWPMELKRAYFEQACMRVHGRHVGKLIPALYHYDAKLYAIVMERLSPHIIMRRGMIEAERYPRFVDDISTYMARSLFFTSDLALPAPEKKRLMADFLDNSELCKITEDLIFTEPYCEAERNRWTSPQLDAIKAEFEADPSLKLAVSRLKMKFMASPEALLHGDLHTGSIMVTQDDTRVIDPEFAFFGPMGFDVGAVIGNLLINYFAQEGHESADQPRDDYRTWVLDCVEAVWPAFAEKFLALWRDHADGDGYPAALFADARGTEALEAERQAYMARLFTDTVGFAAAKMIRRVLGLAHNIDLEWIEDPDRRAACEARCLRLARSMMVTPAAFRSPADLTAAARRLQAAPPQLT